MRTKRKCMTGLPSEGRASGRSCHCELFSMLDGPVSWLPGHPPRALFPLYAVGILRIKARFVSGYSGGGRAGITPASRSPRQTRVGKEQGEGLYIESSSRRVFESPRIARRLGDSTTRQLHFG